MTIKFINGKIKIIHEIDESHTNGLCQLPSGKTHASLRVQPVKQERISREERNRLYYQKHKDDYYSYPFECECGTVVTKVHLNRHRESAKHHKLIQDNFENQHL
jgi:hypothetical protein